MTTYLGSLAGSIKLMRTYLLLVLSLALVPSSLGQAPSLKPSPTASPEKRKKFGSSLKRYDKKTGDWSPDASQEQPGNDSDDEVIRITTDLVVNDLLVVNQKGNPVLGLGPNDFVVTEDGNAQKISMFSFGENATIPRSIVLIIDYSGSQTAFIKNSVEAAKILVEKLAPQDRMAIVTDDVKLLVDFTNDKALLKKELDELGAKPYKKKFGRSEQFTALVATLNEMFDEEDIRPIVIFQTDGDELLFLKKPPQMSSSDYQRMGGIPVKNYSFADVTALVGKSRATIYSIIPGYCLIGLLPEEQLAKTRFMLNEEVKIRHQIYGSVRQREFTEAAVIRRTSMHLRWQLALSEIATLSGGHTDYIEKPEDAENVYSNVFKIINNRYVIGYYPSNRETDGKRRNVKIAVRNYPDYVVMGRKDYFISR